MELATEPDMHSAKEAREFAEELHLIMHYLSVSDADMEKGQMRVEVNISLSKTEEKLGTKVEIKNLNSFKSVERAIEYEIKRQIEILEKGETPIQETRGFDENNGKTYSQRSKEFAHDYRYFPEPDIPPLVFTDDYIRSVEKQIPELPQEKVERYVNKLGLRYNDAFTITRDIKLADYFEDVSLKLKIKSLPAGKAGEKLQLKVKSLEQSIVNFLINKKISSHLSVEAFVKRAIKLLTPIDTDEKELDALIYRLIEANKKVVEDYKNGRENAIMFLVGQVMREMKGRVNAKLVMEKLKKQLSNIKS